MNEHDRMSRRLEELPEVLKVEEAAKVLRICRNAAYDLIKTGGIPSIQLGRSIRVPRRALLDMLDLAVTL